MTDDLLTNKKTSMLGNPEPAAANPETVSVPVFPAPVPEDFHSLYGRRRFLKAMFGGLGLFGAGFLGASAISYLSSSEAMEAKPVELSLADLPVGERVRILYNNQPAEVIRTEKDIVARSMVCTHLGCIVIWEAGRNAYHCPCHDAVFDANGKVVSGPPSMPLENIKVMVKGSTVIVGGA